MCFLILCLCVCLSIRRYFSSARSADSVHAEERQKIDRLSAQVEQLQRQ
jgi:hypothetical protein